MEKMVGDTRMYLLDFSQIMVTWLWLPSSFHLFPFSLEWEIKDIANSFNNDHIQ